MENNYIHGTSKGEQKRLTKLNDITNESFINFIGDLSDKKVCEFGCGLGIVINELADKYRCSEFTGIEISEDHFNQAMQINERNSNVSLINRDAILSGLEDDTFDITYCRYFLEHVSDPVAMVKEMKRITKPGGRIVCQENDLYNVILYPSMDGFDELRLAFCNLQAQMGGDPFIGRRLYEIFHKSELGSIKLSYAPEIFTQEDEEFTIWLENMLSILKVAEELIINEGLATKNKLEELYKTIEDRIENPNGVSYFHWNRVEAIKENR